VIVIPAGFMGPVRSELERSAGREDVLLPTLTPVIRIA
jgi:hypothetical protein